MRFLALATILWTAAACSSPPGKTSSRPRTERTALPQPATPKAVYALQAPFVLEIEAPGALAAGQEAELRIRFRFQGGRIAPVRLSLEPAAGVILVEGEAEASIAAAAGETVERTLRLRVDDPEAELQVLAEMRGEGFGATARRVVYFDGRPPRDPGLPLRRPPADRHALEPLPAGSLRPLTPVVPALPFEASGR